MLPNATVLELGARWGTTTCVISALQNHSGRLIAVEPDELAWESLTSNLAAHGCNAVTVKGQVGKAYVKSRTSNYGTMFAGVESADKPAYSLHALERAHGLRVDTLLIDCEGCVNHFLAGTPGILKRMHTVLLEADMSTRETKCRPNCVDYGPLFLRLQHLGFRLIDVIPDPGNGLQYAFVKRDVPAKLREKAIREGSSVCYPASDVRGGWICKDASSKAP